MFKSHIERLKKSKFFLICTIILLVFPSLEIIQIFLQINKGGSVPEPLYAFFLAGYSNFGMLQSIFFWFLPIYLMLLVADDSIVEFKTGYYNIILSKCSKRTYCLEKVVTSFFISFMVMFFALLLNLLLVNLIFRNGTYNIYEGLDLTENYFFEVCLNHPLITDVLYLVLVSLITGICGSLGAACSLFFKDKKYAYVVTFAMWFILVMQKKSLMLLLQPFNEYPLSDLLEILISYLVIFLGSIAILLKYEIKNEVF